MDEIIERLKQRFNCPVIVLSDHGMRAIGMFGDHSEYGFWSTNFKNLGTPRITDFKKIIEELE